MSLFNSFHRKKSTLSHTWFFYVTLPLFLFLLVYRIGECVVHNLLTKSDPSEKHDPTPLTAEPVPTEIITPQSVQKDIT
ncbi:hypothetical protein AALB16_02450 [Lachnospiraceae bacterium 62-35]